MSEKVEKKSYVVVLPFAGTFHATLEAESEDAAIDAAIEMSSEFTLKVDGKGYIDDERGWMECESWRTYRTMVKGNVICFDTEKAYAEEEGS